MRFPFVLLAASFLFSAPVHAEEITLAAVGDIMLGGSGNALLARKGFEYPFAGTTALLRSSDIAVGNLEAPITGRGTEFRNKRFRFKAHPATAAALKKAGFSVLTLANNHMLDFGADGLAETSRHLTEAGLAATGAGRDLQSSRTPAVVTVKGKKVGFLAYSLTMPDEFFATPRRAGTAPGYLAHVREDVARLRRQADHVVVSFHWGSELATTPKRYQVQTAHAAIDAGADVVLGHHPHVLQGIERYKEGIILYSLGNFAFATQSTKSDMSMIAVVRLDGTVKEVEVVPLNVLNREVRLQPALLDGKRGRRVVGHLRSLSAGMGTSITTVGNRHLVNLDRPARVAAR